MAYLRLSILYLASRGGLGACDCTVIVGYFGRGFVLRFQPGEWEIYDEDMGR